MEHLAISRQSPVGLAALAAGLHHLLASRMLIVSAKVLDAHHDTFLRRGINKKHYPTFLGQILADGWHACCILADNAITQDAVPPKHHACSHLPYALSDDEAVPCRGDMIVFRLLQDTVLLLAAQDALLCAKQWQAALRGVCFRSKEASHHGHAFRHKEASVVCTDSHPDRIACLALCQSCIEVARRTVPRRAFSKGIPRCADVNASCRSQTGCKTQEVGERQVSHIIICVL